MFSCRVLVLVALASTSFLSAFRSALRLAAVTQVQLEPSTSAGHSLECARGGIKHPATMAVVWPSSAASHRGAKFTRRLVALLIAFTILLSLQPSPLQPRIAEAQTRAPIVVSSPAPPPLGALPRVTPAPHVKATGRAFDAAVPARHHSGTVVTGFPPPDLRSAPELRETTRDRIARALHRYGPAIPPTLRSPGAPTSVPYRAGTRPPLVPGTQRPAGALRNPASVDVSQLNQTGVNRWWEYEEGTIPGVGRWMVNAYSQNLIVQADDMDVHYRGVDLAFRRTYNSLSDHDYEDTDGSTEIGQYGKGWTNTFDAHMSSNNCPSSGYTFDGYTGFSVYDVDGARYDYCYDVNGNLDAPPGMQGTSLTATSNGLYFTWQKKNGTEYVFYAPIYLAQYAQYEALAGRMYGLYGRNRNNYLSFTYAFDTTASVSTDLNTIYVTTDSGSLKATLTFADFNGRRLCSSLTFPDQRTQVTYSYDANGELTGVNLPGNNAVPVKWTAYNNYRSSTGMTVSGPRWNAAWNGTSSTDGGYVAFTMG